MVYRQDLEELCSHSEKVLYTLYQLACFVGLSCLLRASKKICPNTLGQKGLPNRALWPLKLVEATHAPSMTPGYFHVYLYKISLYLAVVLA